MRYVVGDLHIGIQWDGLDRTEDIFKVLNDIKTYVHNNADCDEEEIIWLGDVFDHPNVSHDYVSRFISYLRSFGSFSLGYSVKHIILKGNHDGEPDSRKSSPLKEIEASEAAFVIWEPEIIANELFLPYCSQEKVDSFCRCLSNVDVNAAYTHLNITGATAGIEKEIGRGTEVWIPDSLFCDGSHYPIYAGHLHQPQVQNRVNIVGSVLKTSITEANDIKHFLKIDDEIVTEIPIQNRELKNFDINYSTPSGKELYTTLLDNSQYQRIDSDDIVSIRMVCPFHLAHEIDQVKFQDLIRKRCYHLRFDFSVIKERQFRMKELDKALSPIETVSAFVEKQGISEKELIIKEISELMEN